MEFCSLATESLAIATYVHTIHTYLAETEPIRLLTLNSRRRKALTFAHYNKLGLGVYKTKDEPINWKYAVMPYELPGFTGTGAPACLSE